MTIIAENRKTLRPAMLVQCGFRETSDEPTSVTLTNAVQDFEAIANLDMGLLPVTLMDLGGDGFLNDGNAEPMQTDTDSFRYGYISSEIAQTDGTFNNPMSITIQAANAWDTITLELRGQYGDSQLIQVSPIWNGGQTTITIDTWNPGERVYVTALYLGKAWIWDSSNLISVSLDLHSVSTEIGGELEVSSIEIQAYETTDYTDIIGRIPKGAPIWYSAGYAGDMSDLRNFYLSEGVRWDNNILTVRGQDASMLLDDVNIPVNVEKHYSDFSISYLVDRVRAALSSISYTERGTEPAITLASNIVIYEEAAARSVISEYTGIFRDDTKLRLTYVDAGIPTLWIGDSGKSWTIYADEIADLDIIVEQNKNELKMTLLEWYEQYNASIEQVETTAGKTYFVDIDPPLVGAGYLITPTPTSSSEITPHILKFKAAASTTYTVEGYQALEDLSDGNNPYTASNLTTGESYSFDYKLPLFVTDSGVSLTQKAITALLSQSNILYEFTYRGNPHIQPRDVLTVEIATWETVQVEMSGLHPDSDLYPSATLYPNGTYKEARRLVRRWETMTVDTVTLEHAEGGGLSSRIRARKGAV